MTNSIDCELIRAELAEAIQSISEVIQALDDRGLLTSLSIERKRQLLEIIEAHEESQPISGQGNRSPMNAMNVEDLAKWASELAKDEILGRLLGAQKVMLRLRASLRTRPPGALGEEDKR